MTRIRCYYYCHTLVLRRSGPSGSCGVSTDRTIPLDFGLLFSYVARSQPNSEHTKFKTCRGAGTDITPLTSPGMCFLAHKIGVTPDF